MKNIFLSFILLIASYISFAQNWQQLNDSAINFFEKEEYSKAIAIGTKAVQQVKLAVGEKHIDYITCLDNLILYLDSKADYREAIRLFMESLPFRKSLYGENHTNYATDLNNLGVLYEKNGKNDEALSFYLKAAEIYRKIKEGSLVDYINCLNNLAGIYKHNSDYSKALAFYQEAADVAKKEYGENHQEFAISLANLAEIYRIINNYDKAISLCLQAIPVIKKEMGTDSPEYTILINNLAQSYQEKGENEKALPLFLEAKEGFKKIYGVKHVLYAVALNNLGALYKERAEFDKALSFLNEALLIFENDSGKETADYLNCLNNIAAVTVSLGNYTNALNLFQEVMDLRLKTMGKNHPDYANSLNSVAALYSLMGDYAQATPLYEQAVDLRKSIFGINHPLYATAVDNLGMVYYDQGNYEKAFRFLMEAMKIRKKALGENHPDYATSLNNLALLNKRLGNFDIALSFYIESKNIIERNYGSNHPDYAGRLNNIAMVYESLGDNNHALSAYQEVLAFRKNTLGKQHPDYITSLSNLAEFYRKVGDYETALPLIEEAVATTLKAIGEDNPIYGGYLGNLAVLKYDKGEYFKAGALLLKASDISSSNLQKNFNILTEKEKEILLNNEMGGFDILQSLQFKIGNVDTAFSKAFFERQLLLKSMILSDTKNLIDALQQQKDTALQRIFSTWQSGKRFLSAQYVLPIAKRTPDLSERESAIEALERAMNRQSVIFQDLNRTKKIKSTDVQKELNVNEVALEFIRFDFYNKGWTDSVIYAAYIIRKNDSAPVFIPLCEEKQLQHLFDSAGTTASTMVNHFYRGVELGNTNNSSFLGTALYKLIWAPLEPYLKGIKKISYSPAGKLFSVAFQALPVDSNTVLMDKYELQQYTSTRQVALRTEEKQNIKPTNITLFGNASFTMDSLQLVKQKSKNATNATSIYTPKNRSGSSGSWQELPGTAEEVKKIKNLFDENKISTKSFMQTAASEENLKVLSGNSPQVLHIATHGFFLPEADKKRKENNFNNENSYTLADDPLLRSGLILSGGNYAWSGKTPIEGVEDGIATAYEISQLNLSNTELVVLSACETALGDVKGSEGVFGLQRAFKMAGVKKMIVSLWQVPDKETAELMIVFYTNWMKGKTIEESFTQAQAEMRKKYSPFYWAAFVLVE